MSLFVCLDKDGKAKGDLYLDEGDGFGFQKQDYALVTFSAQRKDNSVVVKVSDQIGKRNSSKDVKDIIVNVLLDGKTYTGNGTLKDGITITLK